MILFRALALCALFLAVPTLGWADTASGAVIEISPPVPDAGTAIRIKVQGEWPDSCAPEIAAARVDGHDIVLTAYPRSDNCVGAAQGYATDTAKIPLLAMKLRANGIYRVRYEVRRTADSEPELHGFRLLYVGNTPDPGFVPETGFWWPESGGEFGDAGPGLGVQVEVQARTLSLSVFGYEPDGRASWYFGAGAMTGHTAQIDLSQLNDGAGPFDSYRAPKDIASVGALHFELLTPSRATLWFVRPNSNGRGLNRHPVSMVRFRFAQEQADAWLGRWVVLTEGDDGYPTQRIDFVAVERHAVGFTLSDANNEYRLRCQHALKKPNSPPSGCQLETTSGTSPNVDFDHVALNELRGWTGAGQRIVALKLNR